MAVIKNALKQQIQSSYFYFANFANAA